MIVISLDEGGQFEMLKHPQCMLIGGVAFKCESIQDVEQELQNLDYFFRSICREQQANYAVDLHYNRDSTGNVNNAEIATKVKNALAKELPDFFAKRGRWQRNRPRVSDYYIYCMLGDKRGIGEKTTGNLRDDNAAIRYDHMIYRTIENILFYNPLFVDEHSFVLHLPTRVYTVKDPAVKSQFNRLGFARRKNEQGQFDENTFVVTDEASFRTCIESALLNSDRTDIDFNLSVQSIKYSTPQRHQGFLYLADTVCSIYQDAINGAKTVEDGFPLLYSKCKEQIDKERILLWAYNPIDVRWRKIWLDFTQGKWFESLKAAGLMRLSGSTLPTLYSNIWLKKYERVICSTQNCSALENAANDLCSYMSDMQGRDLRVAENIVTLLQENMQKTSINHTRGIIEYRMSQIRFGLFNHQGKFKLAQEEYAKCMSTAKYVPIEEFLGLQLMYVVSLNDAFCFNEAETIARTVVAHHELLNDIKKETYPETNMIFDSYARSLSQHGQCLAFLRLSTDAIKQFEKALSIFEKRSDDWLITSTYMLHAIIESGDKYKYETYANDFYGSSNPRKQFDAIVEGKCGKIQFALYVFCKALWAFYRDEIEKQDVDMIIKSINNIYLGSGKGHPWELIMKYCALLWMKYFESDKDHSISRKLLIMGENSVKGISESTITKIVADGEKQYQSAIEGIMQPEEEKLTFMYR